ncbi:class I SAM-dependent methyltransferase [Dongia soli]|uniref:Class I SAM-dependent methyltransferase n=1 Tax=Dongia soli TaxID=600628 RepID=A0ABU5EH78_9PROT|nr:class I SAM-dependent methyltransferase [Dongia soli]MDY0885593.1 class I SAM-dependent methyltransferase [Dongia soli]
MRDDKMQNYYRQRARDYEMIYHRPDAVRLAEQEALASWIRTSLAGVDVVEIAAGTGWWTVQAAAVAQHVTATDAVAETLEIAKTKPFDPAKVAFRIADAYQLDALGRNFDGALSCFWLSHVPRAVLRDFIGGLHRLLRPGPVVCLADNCLVPRLGGELVRVAGQADSYKYWPLVDGGTELVLKNYYSEAELTQLFTPVAQDLEIDIGRHFWRLRYRRL